MVTKYLLPPVGFGGFGKHGPITGLFGGVTFLFTLTGPPGHHGVFGSPIGPPPVGHLTGFIGLNGPHCTFTCPGPSGSGARA